MKKIIISFKILVLIVLQLSCGKDDVKIVTPTDNSSLTKVLEFKLDESSGNTTREAFTNTSFKIIGNGINRMAGVSNNALFFDGLSNEINGTLPTNLLPSDSFVLSLWASPKSYPIGTGSMLALTSQGSNTGIMVGLNDKGQIVVQYFINGAFAEQVTNESLERDQWNHIVVGLNPTNQNIVIYVNKQQIKNANVPSGSISFTASNTPFSIGKNTMGETKGIYDIDYFSGALDEIKIYSGEATKENVDALNTEYNPPSSVSYQLNIDYSDDTNRPTYHPIPDFGWANEAYGLVYHKNQYHMFYQKNEVFLGIAQQNWGHFTSTDLVNWKEQNAVLWPSKNWDSFGCWSGDSQILQDDTAAVIYTGVDGIKAVIATATSNDGYQTLDKSSNPIITGAPSGTNLDFRDPYVWESGGKYHMLIGGGVKGTGGNVLYYSSTNFKNWAYGGVAFSGQASQDEGQFWEVPILFEFPNGKEMLLVQKTPDSTPARTFYWIGQFENSVFTPDFTEPKNLEVVNGFLSPTVTTDTSGLITAIGIIPDEVKGEFQMQQGWANLFSVPQVWTLGANDDILIKPHPNLNNLRGTKTSFNGLNVTDGGSNYLNNYNSRHFEMEATINTGSADQVGFILGKTPGNEEYYRVYYDMSAQEWVVDASNSSLSTQVRKDIRKGSYTITPGNTIDVRVFVDGSVLEVFVDNKSHFTGRFFPTFANATGVDVFATGESATIDAKIYEINN